MAPPKYSGPKGPKPVYTKNKRKDKQTPVLGRAIMNNRMRENKIEYAADGEMRYVTEKEEPSWVKLQSKTHEDTLNEFLTTAELADKDFTTERSQQIKIIRIGDKEVNGETARSVGDALLLTKEEEKRIQELQNLNKERLTVPRRPAWDASTTKFELDRMEKEAFLQWRRDLARLVEESNGDLILTPFERNLEVWRQLWRVIDRSDLIVQIVDGRNPLFFRSSDLDKYVSEVDNGRKATLLLINKSDLLSDKQRTIWANYFDSQGIKYAFFSAAIAKEKLEEEEAGNAESGSKKEIKEKDAELLEDERIHILQISELEELFLRSAPTPLPNPNDPDAPPKYQIGLVGYPNVGKSSTINALIGSKKVSVSATPGKTKHFQTIHLSDKVVLCDCPGLVFPNFAYTNADLVCNGVLPIDQLREFQAPATLVARRIPRFYLEAIYGISISVKPVEEGGSGIPTAEDLLVAYAKARGFMKTGFGSADESRAARIILKDYVNGKLLYCEPPPIEPYTESDEEKLRFNSELYTVERLSKYRQVQLNAAAAAQGITLDRIDLAADIAKLTFSSHKSGDAVQFTTNQNYANDMTAGQELDRDFFTMSNVRGLQTNPFHRVARSSDGKKHHKKNQKKVKGKVYI